MYPWGFLFSCIFLLLASATTNNKYKTYQTTHGIELNQTIIDDLKNLQAERRSDAGDVIRPRFLDALNENYVATYQGILNKDGTNFYDNIEIQMRGLNLPEHEKHPENLRPRKTEKSQDIIMSSLTRRNRGPKEVHPSLDKQTQSFVDIIMKLIKKKFHPSKSARKKAKKELESTIKKIYRKLRH